MEKSSLEPIRIAITGGGLAGATLANALHNVPHLEVHVYESAPEFHERGAAVGLAINAQRAMSEIIPSINELLVRAGAVSMNSTRLVIGSGPEAGATVLDLAGTDPGVVVHRAALLRELLAPLPREILSANKRLISIDRVVSATKECIDLQFGDGTTKRVDALIGADGIFGYVRKYVLGKDNPAIKPVPGGWWDCRNLVPMDKAKSKLGEQYFTEHRQYGWVGDGGFIMHDVLDNGNTVQCVGCCREKETSKDRKGDLSRQNLEDSFAGWLDGPIAKGMIDLLLDQDSPSSYSQYEHRNAPLYVSGRVCIIGDAAHAMTPWQGSGAAQAIEDCVILRTLLASIQSSEQLESALQTYDEVRRPRTQRIVESSRITGQIMTGQVEGIRIYPGKMREALGERWRFIYDFDLEKHKDDALATLKRREH